MRYKMLRQEARSVFIEFRIFLGFREELMAFSRNSPYKH